MTLESNLHTQMDMCTHTESRVEENKGKERIERKAMREVKEKGGREETAN